MGAAPGTQRRLGAERSRRIVAGALTEAQFQAQVAELARLHGWAVMHVGRARAGSDAHLTPTLLDGAGWPDLVLCRDRLLFRELKTDRGVVRAEQTLWGERLTAAGQDWAIWRPRDWAEIVETLTAVRR